MIQYNTESYPYYIIRNHIDKECGKRGYNRFLEKTYVNLKCSSEYICKTILRNIISDHSGTIAIESSAVSGYSTYEGLMLFSDAMVCVSVYKNEQATIEVISDSNEHHAEVIKWFDDAFAAFKNVESDKIRLTMCYNDSMHGVTMSTKDIDCPSWESVKENYTLSKDIEHLIGLNNPYEAGKLIFWFGFPGTGKTYAIRALMREWRSKTKFVYVIDPEAFFSVPSYLMNTIQRLTTNVEYGGEDDDDGDGDGEDGEDRKNKKKKNSVLIIIEDGLDILLAETRKRNAGAMGRLLNITEGILGQGINLIVLVTTNEPIKEIDPAYTREGRCLQLLEFPLFDVKTAKEWGTKHGFEVKTKDPVSLAKLYALRSNNPVNLSQIRDTIGFGG